MRNYSFLALIACLCLFVTGCESIESEAKYPTGADRGITGDDNIYEKPKGLFGEDGISLWGDKGDEDTAASGKGSGIGVNSFLWRAALDTISFMPLSSADPFGGVILTDWYSPPEASYERIKLNVYILDRQLRADGIRASVFKQQRDEHGNWVDAQVSKETAIQLEDAILARAREMRVAQYGHKSEE